MTNTVRGESITLNISGPSVATVNSDGSFALEATGTNLLFTTAGNTLAGVPELNFTSGLVRFTVDATGLTTSFTSSGRSTDICAELS